MEETALLLIVVVCLLADGLMEALGLGGFALVPTVTMTVAEGLRTLAGAKKGPLHPRRPKHDARDHYQNHGGLVQRLYHGPARKARRTPENA